MTLQHLGELEYMKSNYAASRDHFLSALDVASRTADTSRATIAEITGNLGAVFQLLGDLDTAIQYDRRALAAFEDSLGPVHANVATMQNNIGYKLKSSGRFVDSAPMYEAALATYRQLYGDSHPLIANTLNNVAMVYAELERLADAETRLRDSLTMYRSIHGDEHNQVATVSINLGRVLLRQGRATEAETLHRAALKTQLRMLQPGHRRIAIAKLALAATLTQQRRFEEALPLAQAARDVFVARDPESVYSAQARITVARAFVGLGRRAEAEPLLTQGHDTLLRRLGSSAYSTPRGRAEFGRTKTEQRSLGSAAISGNKRGTDRSEPGIAR